MKEYLSIKEFAKLTGIEQATLRYWDKIGLFSPVKRDTENNYRYYSPEQIIAVNFITVLSSLNVPLKSIAAVESDRSPEKVMNLLLKQEKLLNIEMRRLVECYSVITTRLEIINYGTKLLHEYNKSVGKRSNSKKNAHLPETGIFIIKRNEGAYVMGPPNNFRAGDSFYEPFMRFCQYAKDLRISLSYPIGAYHENMENFLVRPGLPDAFLSVEPTGTHIRPAGKYMVGFARGYYGQFGDLAERMNEYAKKNGLNISGPVYTVYLHDEICVKESQEYLFQACVAIAPNEE